MIKTKANTRPQFCFLPPIFWQTHDQPKPGFFRSVRSVAVSQDKTLSTRLQLVYLHVVVISVQQLVYLHSCYISIVVSIYVVVISVLQLVYLQLLYQYSSQYICIVVIQLLYLWLQLYQLSCSQYTCSYYISTAVSPLPGRIRPNA